MLQKVLFGIMLCGYLLLSSCGVYSFSGGSYGDAKTFAVALIPNKASLVNPNLSVAFTEKLKDKFLRESPLSLVKEEGDFDFSGYISDYVVAPASIQGDNQVLLNRLTITVHIKFENKKEPKLSFERDFSNYSDFDATKTLSTVEKALMDDINEKLVQDIFQATAMNW